MIEIKDTGKYQLLPAMAPAEFEALQADIAERGVVVPIDIDEDGEIIDGHHRYRAWLALKKNEPPPTIIREGFSEQDKRAFARKNNILRRHLSRAQVRQLIAQQLKETPNWADNRIAKEIGVDGKTVENVRDELLATSEIPKFDRLIGADGKERPAKQPRDKARRQDIAAFGSAFVAAGYQELAWTDLPDDLRQSMVKAGISQKTVTVLKEPEYEPTEAELAELRQWQRYYDVLVAAGFESLSVADQIAWVRRHNWHTPDEWLGESGDRYRASFTRIYGKRYSPWLMSQEKAAWAKANS
jgi:ParB-like chromosome segregation protein Spo0J